MPVTLKTMSMKYRENGNDSWSPAMVQAKAELEPAMEEIAETASEIGIVITGNRPARNVTKGQYVIVRDSTISGISDGLYTANTGLSPNTDVISGNLTGPKSDGGLNDLKNTLTPVEVSNFITAGANVTIVTEVSYCLQNAYTVALYVVFVPNAAAVNVGTLVSGIAPKKNMISPIVNNTDDKVEGTCVLSHSGLITCYGLTVGKQYIIYTMYYK